MEKTESGGWTKIELPPREEGRRNWSLYWKEYESSTDEFEDFLHEPLRVLAEALDEVEDHWRVVTTVFNHQKGLRARIVYATATTSPDDDTVYCTYYKYEPT